MTQTSKIHQARIFLRLVFALTWGMGALGLLAPRLGGAHFSASSPFWFLAAYSASAIGLVLEAIYEGRSGVQRMLARLIPWRSGVHWYLIVLIGYPCIGILGAMLARLFRSPTQSTTDWPHFYPLFVLWFISDPGPLGEEFGWRGFLLPRLLERWSPLRATLLIGIVWSAIHIPAFFIPTLPQSHISFLAFVPGTIAICVFQTWIYLRTGANLLLAILVHGMANFCSMVSGVPFAFFATAEVSAALVVISAGGLKSPSDRQTRESRENVQKKDE